MADTEDNQALDDAKVEKKDKSKRELGGISIVTWAILAVIVILCAGSGFMLGQLFAGPSETQIEPPQKDEVVSPENVVNDDSEANSKDTWYYQLEPALANLNEPGITRYIRASLMLEINTAWEQIEAEKILEEKKPILVNWLTIYLASLTLEESRGDKNLRRIQSQILNAFNEKLFPDSKPQIKHILFKEFVIQ